MERSGIVFHIWKSCVNTVNSRFKKPNFSFLKSRVVWFEKDLWDLVTRKKNVLCRWICKLRSFLKIESSRTPLLKIWFQTHCDATQWAATRFIHRNVMKKSRSANMTDHLGTCGHLNLTNWKSKFWSTAHCSGPSAIYSCSIEPLLLLHSRFPTKKSWVVAYFFNFFQLFHKKN